MSYLRGTHCSKISSGFALEVFSTLHYFLGRGNVTVQRNKKMATIYSSHRGRLRVPSLYSKWIYLAFRQRTLKSVWDPPEEVNKATSWWFSSDYFVTLRPRILGLEIIILLKPKCWLLPFHFLIKLKVEKLF